MKDIFPVSNEWSKNARINKQAYEDLYQQSIADPDAFWGKQAERLSWSKKWHQVKNTSFEKPISIKWFEGGELNACYNCVDRHLPENKGRIAFYWEPDQPNEEGLSVTYGTLLEKVSQMANVFKQQGVKKGDKVTIYLPMIPEAVYAMLACARIGAPHSVVFAGFSADALADRIEDCESDYIITADEGRRGGKAVPLKAKADEAMDKTGRVKTCFVVKHTQASNSPWNTERDCDIKSLMTSASSDCPIENMDAEDPLFILYTSGSTSKPKGVLHTTGGYLTYTSMTFEAVFDYREEDIYWCAADIGWVTGHSYIVYGPLSNAASMVLFEGVPTYPDSSRLWQIVDKYKVNTLYTAPTLLRSLMREGDEPVKKTSRKSLRLLGSVGEPINAEAWHWYHEVVGETRCPIVDTWWQTETGGILISPLPGATDLKPSSATKPFFGIKPLLVDDKGQRIEGAGEGNLCFEDSWPGQMRTVYKNHDRFFDTYFSQFPGLYFSGDGCRRDKDGYYWVTGRIDDVINVSGHRMGTAEVESALDNHPFVAETAVVGFPHEIKGQGIYAYVTLKLGAKPNADVHKQLIDQVRENIGPFAKPDFIQWAPQLPKTRSGKIMRRILRKIAANDHENLGDTSTLADPSVVEQLVENRQNRDA